MPPILFIFSFSFLAKRLCSGSLLRVTSAVLIGTYGCQGLNPSLQIDKANWPTIVLSLWPFSLCFVVVYFCCYCYSRIFHSPYKILLWMLHWWGCSFYAWHPTTNICVIMLFKDIIKKRNAVVFVVVYFERNNWCFDGDYLESLFNIAFKQY